jgi:hypothetical protein
MQNYIFGNKEYFHQNENGEICDLTNNDPETLLSRFNNNTPHAKHQFIKCPKDLESKFALPLYEKYFPDIKFIVNVRHPVKWFQSFYNFRVRRGFEMLPIEELIGKTHHYLYIRDCNAYIIEIDLCVTAHRNPCVWTRLNL